MATGDGRHTIVNAAARAAAWAVVCAAVALALTLLVPTLFGFHRYVITGESMTGAYDRGSIVFARDVPVRELRVGDVITYVPPPGTGVHGAVTHRIVAIKRGRDGRRVFRTKGDANPVADPWTFTLPHLSQARVVAGLPLLGYVPAALGIRAVRIAVIGLPALIIVLLSLGDLRRDLRPPRRMKGAPV
jgi:signal peptidase